MNINNGLSNISEEQSKLKRSSRVVKKRDLNF